MFEKRSGENNINSIIDLNVQSTTLVPLGHSDVTSLSSLSLIIPVRGILLTTHTWLLSVPAPRLTV